MRSNLKRIKTYEPQTLDIGLVYRPTMHVRDKAPYAPSAWAIANRFLNILESELGVPDMGTKPIFEH